MQVFVDGKVITLDDYRKLSGYGFRMQGRSSRVSDKGTSRATSVCGRCARVMAWPIAFWEQVQATEMSFVVEQHLEGESTPIMHDELRPGNEFTPEGRRVIASLRRRCGARRCFSA